MTTTIEIIWDADHGVENEGYYARVHGDDIEDVPLDERTAETVRAKATAMWPDAEITRCDEPKESILIVDPMKNTNMTAGTNVEVKTLPWEPAKTGKVHDNQSGVMPGKVRIMLDAATGMSESCRMITVKLTDAKVIA